MLRVLLAILALIAIVLFVRASRRNSRPDPVAPSPAIGSLEADRETLRALRESGADLTRATEVRYYLYFPTEEAARAAAARASTPELRATVRRAADDSAWLCLVEGEMVPTEGAIHAASARLQAVAATHGGEYDGWEAAVTG